MADKTIGGSSTATSTPLTLVTNVDPTNDVIPIYSNAAGDARGVIPRNIVTAPFIPTSVKTAAYTANAGDYIPVDTTNGVVTITLPIAPADRTRVGIKMVVQGGVNAVTIAAAAGSVFNKANGSTTLTLSLLAQGVLLQYTATTNIWYVQSDDLALAQLDARYLSTATNAGGDLSGTYPNPILISTAVVPGSYTNATLTVDAKGRITSATNGSSAGGVSKTGDTMTGPLTINALESTVAPQLTLSPSGTIATSTIFMLLNGDRPWQFRQSGTGSNAALELNSLNSGKNLTITSANGTPAMTVGVNDTSALSSVTIGGKINIGTGTNHSAGTGTLIGGTATIATTAVTGNSLIFLTAVSGGSNAGMLSVGAKTAGVSFVVNSSNVLDTSTFNWFFVN